MTINKIKVVKYDPQGFIRTAAQFAPFLLTINEDAVQKFFVAFAEEQTDGSLLLPEYIRSFFPVEVIWEDVKPVPAFDSSIGESIVVESADTKYELWLGVRAEEFAGTEDDSIFFDEIGTEHEPVFAIDKSSESGEFVLEQAAD